MPEPLARVGRRVVVEEPLVDSVPLVGVPVAREDRVGHEVLRGLRGDCGEIVARLWRAHPRALTRVNGEQEGGAEEGKRRARGGEEEGKRRVRAG